MLLDWDQKKGSISWRSDGEYFVVNFIDSEAECRKFQVFNRESVLYSTVENDINVLDSPITWKFSKSLIASSIYRFKKHEIVFFERNGLVHGGFPLPFAFNTMKVKEILWNLDSSILCVWSEKTDSESNKYDFVQSVVQLWTMTNYYWYLKQSYNFEMSNKVTALSWDPEDSNGYFKF
jgi:elongator complex protein 1